MYILYVHTYEYTYVRTVYNTETNFHLQNKPGFGCSIKIQQREATDILDTILDRLGQECRLL